MSVLETVAVIAFPFLCFVGFGAMDRWSRRDALRGTPLERDADE